MLKAFSTGQKFSLENVLTTPVKIRAGVLAVDDLKNPPKKKRKNSRVNNLTREIEHAQKRNPLSDLDEILRDGRYPRHNHVCKLWWRSVKGFIGGGGSNFGLSHWHWSSSLQHSRTTVRVCDTARIWRHSRVVFLWCPLITSAVADQKLHHGSLNMEKHWIRLAVVAWGIRPPCCNDKHLLRIRAWCDTARHRVGIFTKRTRRRRRRRISC